MGYKNNDSCLDAVSDDEPIFVLRAQDETAPDMVDAWADNLEDAYRAEMIKPSDELMAKIFEAHAHANVMRAWPRRKLPGQAFQGAKD